MLIALTHGLAIAVRMSAKGHISGGRLNPAVTIGALVGRQIPPRVAVPYWVSLLGDAVAGLVYAYVLHEKKPAAVKSANWTSSRESLNSS